MTNISSFHLLSILCFVFHSYPVDHQFFLHCNFSSYPFSTRQYWTHWLPPCRTRDFLKLDTTAQLVPDHSLSCIPCMPGSSCWLPSHLQSDPSSSALPILCLLRLTRSMAAPPDSLLWYSCMQLKWLLEYLCCSEELLSTFWGCNSNVGGGLSHEIGTWLFAV